MSLHNNVRGHFFVGASAESSMKNRVHRTSRAASTRQVAGRCCAEPLEPRQLFAADLSGAFSGSVPTALLPGGKNKLVLRLVNGGDADASGVAVGVGLFASTDATFDGADIPITSVTTKKLKLKAAGGGTNVNFAFPSPTNVPDGNYFLIAQIDSGSVLSENSEDNNTAVSTSAIEIRQPFVDITGTTQVTAGTITITSGKKVKAPKVGLVVANGGNVPATGTVTATVFASTNASAGDAGDVQIGTVAKKLNTKPQKTTALKAKITIPENLRTGEYNIVTTFNYSGPITESNTTNNAAASTAKITIDNPAFPAGVTVGTLSVDSNVLAVNSAEQLLFDVSIADIPAGSSVTVDLIEVDSAGAVIGTRVAQLLDNGISTNNDATANDGIFSASTALQFSAAGDRFFKGRVTDSTLSTTVETPVLKITGVAAPTEQDVQDAIANATSRQAQLTAAVGAGMPPSAAIEATRQMLLTQADVQGGSIQSGSNAIAYLNFKGILTYLSAKANAVTPTSFAANSAALVDSAALSSGILDCGCGDLVTAADDPATACARAIVLSPQSASLGASDPSPSIVNSLLNPVVSDPTAASFSVASRFGADAGVEAFKGLGQNKFISITGEAFTGGTYGVGIETGQVATTLGNLSNLADLASNRLAIGGDGNYIVTPKFFLHYNGDMDGAVVLANVDYSTEDVGFATAFLRRGAKAVAGFTGETPLDFSRNASAKFVENVTNFVTAPTIDQAVAATIDAVGASSGGSGFTFFGTGEAKLEAGCDLLSDNDLLVEYTWNQNVRDLDTSTEFLGDTVGFSCGAGNQFMTFTGDNTTSGGSESVTLDLKGAFDAGRITTSTMVSASAGWFTNAGGSGPATLTVSLKNKTTGELSQSLTRTISPGTQGDCAATLVGNVTVTLTSEANPRVSITLT